VILSWWVGVEQREYVEVATAKIMSCAVPFGRLGIKAGRADPVLRECSAATPASTAAPREGIFGSPFRDTRLNGIMWQV